MLNIGLTSGSEILASNLVRLRHLAPLLPLTKQKKVLNELSGQHSSSLRGRGMDYAEVRQYQAGDDLRAMDWRVTARTDKPHIKLFQQEKERPVLIVCDLRSNMFFGSRRALKSVLATDLSALLAWASIEAGDRVGAVLFNDTQEFNLRPKPGRKAVLHLLNRMCELALDNEFSDHDMQARMQQICRHVRRIATPGSRIYFISDWLGFDEQCQQQLFNISRHSDIAALHLSDPLERELPPPGIYPITDGLQQLQLDSADAHNRSRYQASFDQQLATLQQQLLALRIPLIRLSTDTQEPLNTLRLGLGINQVSRGAF